MIFKLTKWQLGIQILYCLSDFHFPKQLHNFVGNQQRTTIVQAAKTHDAHVIAEDAYRYMEHANGCDQQYITSQISLMISTPQESPLFGLSSLCYHAGVSTTNVEFRVGSQAPSIPLPFNDDNDTPAYILERVNTIIERIRGYDDGPIANAWYKKILDEYAHFSNGPGRSFLEQLQEQGEQYDRNKVLRAISYSPEMQKALEYLYPNEDWDDFDSYDQKKSLLHYFHCKLLDAELIHTVMQQQTTHKTLFICAGAFHISNIEPVLEQLGYKKVASEGERDNENQEPNAILPNRLYELLESKDVSLPFLTQSTLYLQSFLDGKTTNWLMRQALLSFSAHAIMMGTLLVSPTCMLNKTIVRSFFSSLAISRGMLWYLSQPIRKTSDPH